LLLDGDAQHVAKTLPNLRRATGHVRSGPELLNRESKLLVEIDGQLSALQHDAECQPEFG
jgi:hypothetical protein